MPPSAEWNAFLADAEAAEGRRILPLFDREPNRLSALTVQAAGLTLDLSKQSWSMAGVGAGVALAQAGGVAERRAALFAGEAINTSEDRAVLHPALRAAPGGDFKAKGEPVSAEADGVRQAMADFANAIRSGAAKGATGKPFRNVVHIGIGGSDLGPRLVWEALKPLDAPIALHFAANVDGSDIAAALHGLDPAETLVVAVSKTFTTQETMANALAARDWLRAALGAGGDAHLVAVSANPRAVAEFGVAPERLFAFRDWVGGRFSVWSAVGLSCVIGLGPEAFEGFLAGGTAMDAHFVAAPFEANAPVLLALAQIFNRDGMGRAARAVIPYSQRLRLLPSFLQQLEMESNGKRVGLDGQPVARATAPVVFGEPGTNGQHAFFQMLHQGTDVVPLEFIGVAKNDEGPPGAHAKLLSNLLAQAEALMIGRSEADVRAELQGKGMSTADIEVLAPQRAFPGDRPSSLIMMDALTPHALGALIALYEHKVLVEGVLWGVNSFDQWGVELGKVMAGRILPELQGGPRAPHDPSTSAWIQRLKT
ncbi:MAG TPA: glucose-6-phosphate isomerase [Caulobacteraceae bacterium]|nr:glucose-6-phosphate isomerase [Caulobacteraceae bacterium]